MSDANTQRLAGQIARLLQNESRSDGLESLRSSVEKINERLDGIENALASRNPKSVSQNLTSTHPSQQKFDVTEAIADEIIEHYENEKACTFEPNGKPCDHCSMCSSRGF